MVPTPMPTWDGVQYVQSVADAHVPVPMAKGVERDLHHRGSIRHHPLDFITHGALEDGLSGFGKAKAGDPGKKVRDEVLPSGASALVDGHDEHCSTIDG